MSRVFGSLPNLVRLEVRHPLRLHCILGGRRTSNTFSSCGILGLGASLGIEADLDGSRSSVVCILEKLSVGKEWREEEMSDVFEAQS